eukprot:TRINITY_DN29067_c0_g1_i1.p2 TRINITY_DN29067_c0_g1~~TRINITY_DN29067_c0_g1_i1.p2  ORF type:complete len:182 (+),score=32.90 TRINITY_DN29067_c0_g1_i1:71-547(+)
MSKEASYPDSLVDATYHRTLVTGLSDVEMRITVRKLIENSATDDEIMAEINKLTSSTRNREVKHCDEVKLQQEADTSGKERKRCEAAEDALEQLNARIQTLEAELQGRSSRDKYKCKTCRRDKKQRCGHCWRCGSDSHLQRDCRRSGPQNQGNGNMSH